MKAIKRLAALSLSAVTALTGCGKNGDKSSPTDGSSLISGTFTYLSGEEQQATFYYSDDYFAKSGKEPDEHLRTASLDLTVSVFGSTTGSDYDNARALLSAFGFSSEDFVSEDMDTAPTPDTIGTAISHKSTPSGEVIAVAVRGANYESEWANNFISGASGDAKGFTDSAQKVISRIKAYEEEHGLTGAKLWLTGYSRGGAVCDLAGKYINEHLSEFGITDDDLYVYTFEAPRASSTKSGYANIHNVFDPNDLIPRVYPEQWGLYNAGTPDPILGEEVVISPMALDLTDGLEAVEVEADPTTVQDFEAELLEYLDSCVTREEFSSYSSDIGTVITLLLTRDAEGREEFTELVAGAIGDVFNGSAKLKLMPLYTAEKGSPEYDSAMDTLTSMISENLDSADHSTCLSESEYTRLRDSLPGLVSFLAPIIVNDMTHDSMAPFQILGTFIGNLDTIFGRHDPSAILTAVEALDPYHN